MLLPTCLFLSPCTFDILPGLQTRSNEFNLCVANDFESNRFCLESTYRKKDSDFWKFCCWFARFVRSFNSFASCLFHNWTTANDQHFVNAHVGANWNGKKKIVIFSTNWFLALFRRHGSFFSTFVDHLCKPFRYRGWTSVRSGSFCLLHGWAVNAKRHVLRLRCHSSFGGVYNVQVKVHAFECLELLL